MDPYNLYHPEYVKWLGAQGDRFLALLRRKSKGQGRKKKNTGKRHHTPSI